MYDFVIRRATFTDATRLAELGARTFRDTFAALWLGVWDRNFRARAFYARWGFVEVGDLVLALPL